MRGAGFQAGACEVHLIEVAPDTDVGRPPAAINPAARHAAFLISSYPDAVAFAKDHGLDVFETNEKIGQLWIRDPDGHVLEMIAANQSGPAKAES